MVSESEPIAASERARPRIGAIVLVLGLAVGILALDQLAKWLVVSNLEEGVRVDVIGWFFGLTFVRNPGAAFSLGVGATWIFALIAVAVAVFIIVFARRIKSLAWATVFGMLLGGTLGNLADRLLREPGFGRGAVIDFFQIWGLPFIFNVADVAITFSVVLLVILTIAGIGLDGRRSRGRLASDAAPSDVVRSDATDGDA